MGWSIHKLALARKSNFWISRKLIESWMTTEKSGLRGASPTYTDAAIETPAMVIYLSRR